MANHYKNNNNTIVESRVLLFMFFFCSCTSIRIIYWVKIVDNPIVSLRRERESEKKRKFFYVTDKQSAEYDVFFCSLFEQISSFAVI